MNFNKNSGKHIKSTLLNPKLLENDLNINFNPKFINVNIQNSKLDKDNFSKIIDNILRIEQSLFETSDLINKASQLQLLLIVLESFVSITFNCYYLATIIFFTVDNFKLQTSDAITFLLQHLIQPWVNILVVVIGFQIIQNSFQNTQTIVNKLIIQNKDESLGLRLLQFSQQMHVNAPTFNVYRLFQLDGSLIASICAATTTYLIILLQFSDNASIIAASKKPN